MLNNESRPRPPRPQRDINLTALETLPPNMFPVAGSFATGCTIRINETGRMCRGLPTSAPNLTR